MIFRLAGKEDIAQLTDIRIQFLTDDSGAMAKDDELKLRATLSKYFNAHIGKDFYPFIAESGGVIVSSVCLLIQERPASLSFPTGKTGLIVSVYTCRDFRRRGLAEKLMTMAVDEAKRHDLSYIELKATKSGEKLYDKLGFKYDTATCVPMKYIL